MRLAIAVAVASCHRGADEPRPAMPLPQALAEASDAHPLREHRVKTEATNDLAHHRARLAPLLASAQACVPRADLLGPDGDPIALALDSYQDQLVACAQVITRRGGSVFHDPVSFACWNVDPRTANVTRRADLGRSYFRCQDGGCSGDHTVVSHDGLEQLSFDEAKETLAIATRAGAASRSFASPPELQTEAVIRGVLTYVGKTIFVLVDGQVIVLDDRGKALGRTAGTDVHVMDGGHVLIPEDADHAALWELANRTSRRVQLRSPFAAAAVSYRGAMYAIDDAGALVVLDDTFRVKQTLPLAVCR